MNDIDSGIKRPVNYAQPRIAGQFFKSGTSLAPALSKFKQHSPRYSRFRDKKTISQPFSLFNAALVASIEVKKARDHARHIGIPSADVRSINDAAKAFEVSPKKSFIMD